MVLPRNNTTMFDPNDPYGTMGASGSMAASSPQGLAAQRAAMQSPSIPVNPSSGNPVVPTGSTDPTNPNAGLQAATGWAGEQGYVPGMLNAIYENPWYILPDVFPGLGMTSPLYQGLRDFGADPLALYNIMVGSQTQGPIDTGGSGFANWLQNLYKQLGTPGGRGIDAGSLIRMLFGADDESGLGLVLGAGDMGTQVRTMFNLLRDASNAGMDPLQARGYQAAIARAGDQYGNEQLKAGGDDGASMTFQEWANKNAPWLTGR